VHMLRFMSHHQSVKIFGAQNEPRNEPYSYTRTIPTVRWKDNCRYWLANDQESKYVTAASTQDRLGASLCLLWWFLWSGANFKMRSLCLQNAPPLSCPLSSTDACPTLVPPKVRHVPVRKMQKISRESLNKKRMTAKVCVQSQFTSSASVTNGCVWWVVRGRFLAKTRGSCSSSTAQGSPYAYENNRNEPSQSY
jgi:hypothetical protein